MIIDTIIRRNVLKLLLHKQVRSDQWWEYVDRQSKATAFHTPFMHDSLVRVPGIMPFALFAVDEDMRIVGMINGYKQRLFKIVPGCIGSRAVIMQAPLFDSAEVLDYLLKEYRKTYRRKILYTEIRAHYDLSEYKDPLRSNKFYYEDHLNIIVDLNQSEDVLWSQVHTKRRNEIRKAQKSGLTVREINRDEFNYAYDILKEVYARAKLPLIDICFFEQCLALESPRCRLAVFGAFNAEKIVGTMFTLMYKDTVYDFYAGSLVQYYHMNPNDIIPWSVFIEGKKLGFTRFDFGGAGKPDVPYGVRDYKKKFGGSFVNYGRYMCTDYRIMFGLFKYAKRLVQKSK